MSMRSMSREAHAGVPNRSEAEIARHFVRGTSAGKPTARNIARRTMLRGRSIVNITEDVRKYAAEQALSEEDALPKSLEEKSQEFADKSRELYAKA